MERSFAQDIRHAVRSLRGSPALAVAAAITITLGIGATAAIFSVVNAVLLRPLPYADPERLVLIQGDLAARNVTDFPQPPADLVDMRQQGTLFSGVAGVFGGRLPLRIAGSEPEVIPVGFGTADLFALLGTRAVRGRVFIDQDGAPLPPAPAAGAAPAAPPPPGIALLSWDFWHERFGGSDSVLGRTLEVGGRQVEIVGVLPRDFELLLPPRLNLERRPLVWIAARIDLAAGSRINVFMRWIGRLKPGVSVARAQEQVNGIVADLRSRFPIKATAGLRWRVEPMQAYLVADVKSVMIALMGAVIFVLLIASANVSNLMMVRAAGRERELVVRAALGARRRDLVRQMLAEVLVISGTGAVLGVALAYAGVGVLRRLAPRSVPRIDLAVIDLRVLAVAALSALLAAALVGVVPALRATRPDAGAALRGAGRTGGLAAGRRLRAAVVVAEVALSFVLLVGSGLMVRSLVSLVRADPGFVPGGLLTFQFGIPRSDTSAGLRRAFQEALRARLAALPGVTRVAAAFPLPLDASGAAANGRWGTEEAVTDPTKFQQADVHVVTAGYFETMGTRLIAGRLFTDADNDSGRTGIIIDRVLAAKAFPSGSAVGRRLYVRMRGDQPEWFDVIGVVDHERMVSTASDSREAIYAPDGLFNFAVATAWLVRTPGDPMALAAAVRGEAVRAAPDVPIANLKPMDDYVSASMAPTRFALALIGLFAVIAAVLAAVGLYGVLATAVRQRTAEIGIRMTFGARRGGIFRLVIGQGLRLCGGGIVIGLLAAVALTRVMASLLVGVRPVDPATFAAIGLLFVGVATLASWAPARRAAALDPAVALRQE